jgi:uncharacterized Zn-binding protein involved in type VI secretion
MKVVRLGDICTGHDCFPSRPNNEASNNVFVNNLGVHRVGDSWDIHCCPDNGCHDSVIQTGSPNVFVNNKPVARVGDRVACGSFADQGSPNVIIN